MRGSTGNTSNNDGRHSTADLMAAVTRMGGRNRWPKHERADWERAFWESYADEDEDDFE